MEAELTRKRYPENWLEQVQAIEKEWRPRDDDPSFPTAWKQYQKMQQQFEFSLLVELVRFVTPRQWGQALEAAKDRTLKCNNYESPTVSKESA